MAIAFLAFGAIFARAEPVRIVGFGNSLMAGYQLSGEDGFTERLQTALRERGIQAIVANAGVSGDTSTGGLQRLDWSVPDDTDLVIVELGANDALRGLPPEKTEENLDAIITRLKERGMAVLLAGMLAPPNMGRDYENRFNGIYPRLAERHDIPLYRFFLDGVAANPALLLADGMHPNPQGVLRMVEGIAPMVLETISAMR